MTDDRPIAVAFRALKLGDLLVAVPALKAMRLALPGHRLVLATTGWLEPVVRLVPGVDEHVHQQGFDHPLRVDGPIDVIANLHGNGPESEGIVHAARARRTIEHDAHVPWIDGMLERRRWVRLVDAWGMPGDPDDLAIDVPQRPSAAPGAAVVHVGAGYRSREWPAERFAAVARALADDGERVVFSGGAADRDRALDIAARAGLGEESVLAGTMPLDGFAALVAAASVLVSVDTGAAHLASAYRVPSVVLFGPAPVEEWGPPPGPHIVLTDARLRRGDVFATDPDPALLAVTVEDVVAALRDLPRAGQAGSG